MAERPLADRYRQYKAGTAKLVSWLANTARRSQDITGIVTELQGNDNAVKPSHKRKHRFNLETHQADIPLTTSQLLHLADLVVKSGAAIPEAIIQKTEAVIAARQLFARWYLSLTPSLTAPVEEQNKKHQHFIEVLQQIRDMLRQARTSMQIQGHGKTENFPTEKEPVAANFPEDILVNMFAALHVEEPNDASFGGSPNATDTTIKKCNFKLEESHDTKTFAIWCLLQDMRDVRLEVRALWEEYIAGAVSLNIVGSVTEYAVGLLRYAETELLIHYPDLADYFNLVEHLGLTIKRHGQEVYMVPEQANVSNSPHGISSSIELANLFCPRAAVLIKAFQGIITAWDQGLEAPDENDGMQLCSHPLGEQLYETFLDFAALKGTKYADRETLFEILTNLQLFANQPQWKPRPSQVIGVQIAMDARYILGRSAKFEVELFRKSVNADIKSLSAFEAFLIRRQDFTSKLDLARPLHAFLQDPYHELIHRFARTRHVVVQHSEFRVHEGFPSVSGKLMQDSANVTRSVGMVCCSRGHLVLSLAYLYKALRRACKVSEWADMEFLINGQNRQKEWILEPETGRASWLKCFGVSLGMTTKMLRQTGKPNLSKSIPKTKAGRDVETPCPLFKLIISSEPDLSTYGRAAFLCFEELKASDQPSQTLRQILEQYEKTGRLTPAQLLSSLTMVFKKNDLDLHFGYIRFARSCTKLMEKICDQINSDPSSKFGSISKLDHSIEPYQIVYEILREEDYHKSHDLKLDESLLYRIAPTIESHIERSGSKCVQAAQEAASISQMHVQPLKTATESSITAVEVASIKRFVGIPDKEAAQSGYFCRSEEESSIRAEIMLGINVHYGDGSAVRAAMTRLMDANLGQMTVNETCQLQNQFHKLIAEDEKAGEAGELKSGLREIGFSPETILDRIIASVQSGLCEKDAIAV